MHGQWTRSTVLALMVVVGMSGRALAGDGQPIEADEPTSEWQALDYVAATGWGVTGMIVPVLATAPWSVEALLFSEHWPVVVAGSLLTGAVTVWKYDDARDVPYVRDISAAATLGLAGGALAMFGYRAMGGRKHDGWVGLVSVVAIGAGTFVFARLSDGPSAGVIAPIAIPTESGPAWGVGLVGGRF